MRKSFIIAIMLLFYALGSIPARAQVTGAGVTVQSPGCASVSYIQLQAYSYNFGLPVLCWDTTAHGLYYWNGATSGTVFTALSGGGGSSCSGDINTGCSQVTNLSHVTNGSLASGALAPTSVTAGSYTSANVTVNAQGQITAAANGSGSGSVTSVATGYGLTGGPITTSGTASAVPAALGVTLNADQCSLYGGALPNDGSSDDAAPLRLCMTTFAAAVSPNPVTFILDPTKPYFFSSHTSTWTGACSGYNGQSGELAVCNNQELNMNGATITQAPGEAGTFVILMGTLQFNTPGSSGGSPTFIPINDTAMNASSVTTVTASNAGLLNPGDDVYLDCGSNTGNADVFVGWDQVSDTNSSTGVIDMKYPMLKPYNHTATSTGCPGSPSAARIYDWTTSGGGSAGPNLGPLAHNVYLEGPGKLILASGGTAGLAAQGLVNWGIDRIDIDNHLGNAQFEFGNNNHLGYITNSRIISYGCSGDTQLNPGQFASSYNILDHDTATATGDPGVGCGSGTHEAVLGDSEGGEANHYSNMTVTVLPGLASNVSSNSYGGFFVGTWDDTIDHSEFNTVYPGTGGVVDGLPSGGNVSATVPSQGPLKITNSHFGGMVGSSINFAIPYDTATGNTIECTNTAGCILAGNYPVVLAHNTINESQCSGTTYGINVGNGANTITGNQINAISGSCSTGIGVGGSSSTARLSIVGNTITGFASPTNFSSTSFPDASVYGNPGVPNYPIGIACTSCPMDPTLTGISGNTATACPLVPGGTQPPSFTIISVQNPRSITCSTTYPQYAIGDPFISSGPFYTNSVTMTSSAGTYNWTVAGGVISGSLASDPYFFYTTTAGSGCTCTPGTSDLGCAVYVTACYQVQ